MLTSMLALLESAREGGFAVGGFSADNLESVHAILAAAEAERSPVILQVASATLRFGGTPFAALCLEAAREASVPVAVQFDHGTSPDDIRHALAAGIDALMIDGSRMAFERNVLFTRNLASLAHERGAVVEAELGRLVGSEDAVGVEAYEDALTDPDEVAAFVQRTGVDALAVCIGNVHGPYHDEPMLDLIRLAQIRQATDVPLVLHGASGLPDRLVRVAIELGVRKFDTSTEVRYAYLRAVRSFIDAEPTADIVALMDHVAEAMQTVVTAKLHLLGSAGRVEAYSPLT